MSFSCSDRVILAVVKRVKVGTVKQFPQLQGLMAAASNAVHETPTVVAQDQGGQVLGAPGRCVMLAMDASLTGWGVVMNDHRGLWSGHHPAWHISCLETLAMFQ
ncbi:hypothetical protein M9458_006093, partial [Cirrhinus mrigala]